MDNSEIESNDCVVVINGDNSIKSTCFGGFRFTIHFKFFLKKSFGICQSAAFNISVVAFEMTQTD